MNGKREFGDYQTPDDFAEKVCEYLLVKKHVNPEIVIEPTCGKGSFIRSSLKFNASEIIGIEINKEYCDYCLNSVDDNRVSVINTDFFGYDLRSHIKDKKEALIIGNPPWVTNSDLSSLGSKNLPEKVNFKSLKGMDAITGSSNFDICEYMMLQILFSLKETNTTMAMLCKTSVARNVFAEIKRKNIPFDECELLEFDATKVFGISASACIFIIKLSDKETSIDVCRVYDFESGKELSSFGYRNNQLYSNLDFCDCDYEGKCEFEWRQGVKHDCSKIMELRKKENKYVNGNKEELDIEELLVFPLIKSSMFKKPIISDFDRFVIVTQKKARAETSYIEKEAPKTWKYLNSNVEAFRNRKSSIYRGAPEFSMFGVGDYSYSEYKVGVSGFYKTPLFSVLYSDDGKPVMTDDTSYFICFDSYDMAYVAMLILNEKKVQSFIKSIAFLDAKRPYTKKVLERISIKKILSEIEINDLKETENVLGLESRVTKEVLEDFKKLPELNTYKQVSIFD